SIAAALQTDDVNLKRRHLERAVALDPSSAFARLQLAQHELGQDHPDLALPALKKLLEEHPRFGPAHVSLARALEELHDRTQAQLASEAAFAALPLLPSV